MTLDIEPYRPDHAPAVVALLDVTPELPKTTEASFRAFTQLGFNRGARDFRVIGHEGGVVALLTSTLLVGSAPLLRHFRIVVHPDHRRRGLATRLLREAATQGGAAILQCNSQDSWGPANAFLDRHGFEVAQRELLMRRSSRMPERAPRGGVSLRPATPDDDPAWAELHAVGYADRDDYGPLLPEDRRAERARPGFTLFVAEAQGRVVGLGHGMHHEGHEGLIHSVVVRPEHRRQGIGAALVTATARGLAAHGCEEVSLNVRADDPARRLYERLGFATYDAMSTHRREA